MLKKGIYENRANELKFIQYINLIRSAKWVKFIINKCYSDYLTNGKTSIALSFSIPVLAATLAFVTYTKTSHAFNVAIIFSSFSLFQLLRQPLLFLPRALAAISDAKSAIQRLEKVFHAEMRQGVAIDIDPSLDAAVLVEKATFEWEEIISHESLGGKRGKGEKVKEGKHRKAVVEEEVVVKKDKDAAP